MTSPPGDRSNSQNESNNVSALRTEQCPLFIQLQTSFQLPALPRGYQLPPSRKTPGQCFRATFCSPAFGGLLSSLPMALLSQKHSQPPPRYGTLHRSLQETLALESARILALLLQSSVALVESPCLTKPQLPHLLNGDTVRPISCESILRK